MLAAKKPNLHGRDASDRTGMCVLHWTRTGVCRPVAVSSPAPPQALLVHMLCLPVLVQ